MEKEQFEQALKSGLDTLRDDLRGEVVSEVETKVKSLIDPLEDKLAKLERPNIAGNGTPAIDITQPEEGRYKSYGPKDSVYKDRIAVVTDEADKIRLGAFLRAVVDRPQSDAERQLLTKSLDSSGYQMPEIVASEFIDLVRHQNPVVQAGARTITLDDGKTTFVRLIEDPTVEFLPELEQQTDSEPTFGGISFAPKTLRAYSIISREALQDAVNLEQALSTAFSGAVSDAIVSATFSGDGVNEPLGLADVVTATSEYPNAGAPTWSTIVEAVRKLYAARVPKERISLAYAPDVWASLTDQTGQDDHYVDAPRSIRDLPEHVSAAVPAGVAYAGDFSNVVYGVRMGFAIERYNGVNADRFASTWLIVTRLDIQTFRPASFVRIEEAAA